MRLSNPDRVYFSARGETKLDLARYYLAVSDGIVRALRERPCMMHRFPTGTDGEKVHQKRLPKGAPDWVKHRARALPALQPHRRRAVRHQPRRRHLGRADVDRGVPPLEQPRGRRRDPRRVAHRPRPHARRRVPHRAPGGRGRPGGARRPRRRRASRRPRAARACTSTCASAPSTRSPRCAGRRSRSPARSSAAPPTSSPPPGGARTASPGRSSSTGTRTPATTRSPRPTRCAGRRRRGCRRRCAGTRSPTPSRATSRSRRCPPATPRSATCTAGIDESVFDLRALLEWAERDEGVPDEPPEV